MRSQKGSLVIILVIVVLIVLVGGIYVYYLTQQQAATYRPLQNQAREKIAESDQKDTSLKTYTDDKLKFSFQYPSDGKKLDIRTLELGDPHDGSSVWIDDQIQVLVSKLELGAHLNETSSQDKKLSGVEATEYTYISTDEDSKPIQKNRMIVALHNGYYYSINVQELKNSQYSEFGEPINEIPNSSLEIYNTIVDTFRF